MMSFAGRAVARVCWPWWWHCLCAEPAPPEAAHTGRGAGSRRSVAAVYRRDRRQDAACAALPRRTGDELLLSAQLCRSPDRRDPHQLYVSDSYSGAERRLERRPMTARGIPCGLSQSAVTRSYLRGRVAPMSRNSARASSPERRVCARRAPERPRAFTFSSRSVNRGHAGETARASASGVVGALGSRRFNRG